jgi:HlyD family secretion protein
MPIIKFGFLGLLLSLLAASCGNEKTLPGGSGLIEATEVVVSAESGGQLKELFFNEGDGIKNGDTIALIDTLTITLRLREMSASLTAAETRLNTTQIGIEQADFNHKLAHKEYERISELIKSGSVNQQQYDQIETAYYQAQLAKKQAVSAYQTAQADIERITAGMALLKKQFDDCHPVSPVSGNIVDKFVEVGELMIQGKQLVKIAKLDTVWVKVYLSSSDLARIKLGGIAKVDPEDGQNAIDGNVSWISPAAEFTPKNVQTKEARADLVYAVKVIIPNANGRLKIGMPVLVEIP